MNKLKVVFMGTPVFACSILEALISAHYQVIGVVSQPDKKVGRKQVVTHTPVKEVALKHHIPVFQPIRIKDDYQSILDLCPDLIVTCAYGQMIPVEVLEYPRLGSLNVHASLLPKLRGGAPIHKAIIYGESETGVSIMRMVQEMDAGDYMLQKKVSIDIEDTTGTLHDKLMVIGSKAILEAIELLKEGKAVFVKQQEEDVSFASNISKEEEYIDFNQDYLDVYNHIRGLIPWPVGYIKFDEKKLKVHSAKLSTIKSDLMLGSLFVKDKQLYLVCKNGCIELLLIQLEGKKACSYIDFINGMKHKIIGA